MKKAKIHISEDPHGCDLESLGNIFIPIMKDVLSAEDFVEADILWHWGDIVGEEIALFCNPLKTKFNPKDNNRTLYVEVPAGGFALELRHRESYILEKINMYFGYRAVHKINISQNMNMQVKTNVSIQAKQSKEELAESDKKYLDELTAEIKDEKLREILIKLGENVILSTKGAK